MYVTIIRSLNIALYLLLTISALFFACGDLPKHN